MSEETTKTILKDNDLRKKELKDAFIFNTTQSIKGKTITLLDDIYTRAKHYGAIAKDALGIFGNSKEKNILLNVVDFVIDRNF